MGVRAEWHIPDLALGDEDPFADGPTEVSAVGVRIDLRDDPDELFGRLRDLLGEESDLYNQGVVCAVKAKRDTSCHACPFRGRYGQLCRVGTEQEEVLTRMAFLDVEGENGGG